jgi:hypothetical protein
MSLPVIRRLAPFPLPEHSAEIARRLSHHDGADVAPIIYMVKNN